MINNNELIDQIKSYNKFLNSESLNKAYSFAVEAHQNQKRDEGVPYIIHPVAVAKILTELKLDSATITTGLLHDTIEDTNVTYEKVKKEFGEEVANLVEGVTKISALEDKASIGMVATVLFLYFKDKFFESVVFPITTKSRSHLLKIFFASFSFPSSKIMSIRS